MASAKADGMVSGLKWIDDESLMVSYYGCPDSTKEEREILTPMMSIFNFDAEKKELVKASDVKTGLEKIIDFDIECRNQVIFLAKKIGYGDYIRKFQFEILKYDKYVKYK